MREQLKNIQEYVENKSRIGFIFTKGKFVSQIERNLNEVESNISTLEEKHKNLESEHTSLTSNFEDLTAQYQKLNQAHDTLTSNFNTLTKEHHNLENEHSTLANNFDDLTMQHQKLDGEHQALHSDFNQLTIKHQNLEGEHTSLTSHFEDLTAQHQKLNQAHDTLTSNFNTLTKEHHNLENEHSTLANNFDDLTMQHQKLDGEHQALHSDFNQLTIKHQNLEGEHSSLTSNFKDLTAQHQKLDDKHHLLTSEFKDLSIQYSQLELKEKLISNLLSTEFHHKGVENFENVLNNDFMAFANSESSLDQEAKAILMLQNVRDKLKEIAIYPEFFNKRKIAVGGGFSAGKSQFINSLLNGDSMLLPTNIKPTTAIPTYVMHGKENGLLGNNSRAMVNLTKIDPDISHKLSHEFIASFGFNLKDIMPYMVMTTKLNYQHLCFVDTPGYNPAGSSTSYTDQDKDTANQFIQSADAILWIVPVTAGTLSQSDIDFLAEINLENKPLYIVVNKCDLRPKSVIKEVLLEIQDKLEDAEIEYSGISAYSSSQKKEYFFEKKSLSRFLIEQNNPADSIETIMNPLREVKNMYFNAIEQDIKQKTNIKGNLDEIRQKLVSNRDWRSWSSNEDLVDKLYSYFDVSDDCKHLQQLDHVMQKFTEAVEMVFPKETIASKQASKQASKSKSKKQKFARFNYR